MEQLNPSFPLRPMPPMMPQGLGNPPNNPLLPQGAFGGPILGPIRNQLSPYPNDQDEKRKEFARGVFVSGFEKNVTSAMIQNHFSIKPIHGLKHPVTKFKESKGFAFIYYGSEDDALYVKKTLDRTSILKDKIRITRTVISQNLSKMMFKLKTHGYSEKEVQENEAKYFNDENLEKQVERIIKPIFGTTVQVNKITIPHSKSDKKPLRYARVFFYVSDVKQAKNVAQKVIGDTLKNEYQKILSCISEKINNDQIFSKYAKSEIYEYTKKNQSNVLHLKGIKHNPNEDPAVLAEQVKDFMQKSGPQWNIVNSYASAYQTRGSWANLTFSTYEETIQAYEHLKNLRPKFRDNIVYGSLRNVKDSRTVVISVVRKDATEKDIQKFLTQLASNSKRLGDETANTRKYDYFSFNIIQSKKFFKIDGDDTKSVTEDQSDTIQPSWIEINEVPRRLIIHFFHQFTEQDIKELNNDITVNPGYDRIFLKGDTKKQLRSNHQKGHVNKDGVYIKHTELKSKKKEKQGMKEKPQGGRRNMDMNPNRGNKFTRPIDFTLGALPMKGGAPKLAPPNFNGPQFGRPPPIGHTGPMGVPPMAPPFPGNRPPQPNFNPPQPFVGTNMPPPPPNYSFNKPPTYLPPGAPNLQGNIPPPPGLLGKGMPPMPGNFPQFTPYKPMMPPTTAQPPKNE